MLTSTESIGKPGHSAKEEMHVQIQLEQQQQPQHTIIFVEGNGPEPVPKLEEPTCCCGCNVKTASIIMAIIHALLTWNYIENAEDAKKVLGNYYYVPLAIYGGMGLCYAGIAFCRTEQLCSIVSAVNHLFSIPMYLFAVGMFVGAYELRNDKHGYQGFAIIQFWAGVVSALIACSYTYMATKYQEFGEYLNKENKQ